MGQSYSAGRRASSAARTRHAYSSRSTWPRTTALGSTRRGGSQVRPRGRRRRREPYVRARMTTITRFALPTGASSRSPGSRSRSPACHRVCDHETTDPRLRDAGQPGLRHQPAHLEELRRRRQRTADDRRAHLPAGTDDAHRRGPRRAPPGRSQRRTGPASSPSPTTPTPTTRPGLQETAAPPGR